MNITFFLFYVKLKKWSYTESIKRFKHVNIIAKKKNQNLLLISLTIHTHSDSKSTTSPSRLRDSPATPNATSQLRSDTSPAQRTHTPPLSTTSGEVVDGAAPVFITPVLGMFYLVWFVFVINSMLFGSILIIFFKTFFFEKKLLLFSQTSISNGFAWWRHIHSIRRSLF